MYPTTSGSARGGLRVGTHAGDHTLSPRTRCRGRGPAGPALVGRGRQSTINPWSWGGITGGPVERTGCASKQERRSPAMRETSAFTKRQGEQLAPWATSSSHDHCDSMERRPPEPKATGSNPVGRATRQTIFSQENGLVAAMFASSGLHMRSVPRGQKWFKNPLNTPSAEPFCTATVLACRRVVGHKSRSR